MFKRIKKAKLGRKASHKRLLVRNMLRSLFTTGYLTTTTLRAKALREAAMKVMNILKKPDLNILKKMTVTFGDRKLVEKVANYVKNNEPKIKVVKIGYRDGDKAEVSRISVVGYVAKKAKKETKEEKKEEKKEEVKEEAKTKGLPKGLGKQIKETFVGRKERARTRSGI